jgi:predicted RecB family nuclease
MITQDTFQAYLNCETKASLLLAGEAGHEREVDFWERHLNDDYQQSCSRLLLSDLPEDCFFVGTPPICDLLNRKHQLVIDCVVEVQGLQSRIHALERANLRGGRNDASSYTPIRFVRGERLTRHDKLLLAFDALVLSEALGQMPSFGKIVHGTSRRTVRLGLASLVKTATLAVEGITGQTSGSPPQLVLNKHCGRCEFQLRCRQIAIEKDDLSLLSGMTQKERKNHHEKGIFTVAQLSYTYRPRRRPKYSASNRSKYDNALKALAIREGRIYISGRSELDINEHSVYLDVEGLPDVGFYYLIGFRIKSGNSATQLSFWANEMSDEKVIWNKFLQALSEIERPQLIHYGGYETVFLKQMKERHGEDPLFPNSLDEIIAESVDVLSIIRGQVYFPTYSNGLKEIAQYLGFQWSQPAASGLDSIGWRYKWESSKDSTLKERLLAYNAEDCEALERVAETVVRLQRRQTNDESHTSVVNTDTLKAKNSYRFGPNEFSIPELEYVNRCAYWDYQRDRIYVRSNRRFKRPCKPSGHGRQRPFSINKTVLCAADTSCPRCHAETIHKYGKMRKVVYDIKFGPSGVRRCVTKYVFNRYICAHCRATFVSEHRPLIRKYGSQLRAYLIYQVIELHLPQLSVAENIRQLFGFRMNRAEVHRQKVRAAQQYKDTFDGILKRIVSGKLVHADETKVNLEGKAAFVWVLTNMEEVAYFYTETRSAERVQALLQDFKGVLVSDFYAGYDSIECPQQKCLIHLIRDMNDDLLKHPFDEPLKKFLREFAILLRTIIDTVERFGLKARFLRRHRRAIDRFYENSWTQSPQSEIVSKYMKRFEKNRNKLFTFLEHDGVPWNNNNAEHAIKAFARLRNVIKGSSTDKGIQEYLTLLSVSETCKYMEVSFLDFLKSECKDIDGFVRAKGRRKA